MFRSAPKQEVRKTLGCSYLLCHSVSLCSQTGGSQNKMKTAELFGNVSLCSQTGGSQNCLRFDCFNPRFRSAPKQEVRKTKDGNELTSYAFRSAPKQEVRKTALWDSRIESQFRSAPKQEVRKTLFRNPLFLREMPTDMTHRLLIPPANWGRMINCKRTNQKPEAFKTFLEAF